MRLWLTLKILEQKYKVKFREEFRFHPTRRWKFDFACEEIMLATEYEGLFSVKSRHTTEKGYTRDCEKYNQAQILGWQVLRYTPLNLNQAYDDIEALLKKRSS